MRRAAYMAAAALALAAQGGYVNVPQDAPEKYIFTRPSHPDGILGKVMDPADPYRMMRSEDIDWLKEAAAERTALMLGTISTNAWTATVAEFGKWPLSGASANGYSAIETAVFFENGRPVTNVVARYRTATNTLGRTMAKIHIPSVDFSFLYGAASGQPAYIDVESRKRGEVECYIEDTVSPTSAEEEWTYTYPDGETTYDKVFPTVTNIYTEITTNWTGRYLDPVTHQWKDSYRTNISYLTMAMTNGTTSVHTNIWTQIEPREERHTVTNIYPFSWPGLLFKDGIVEPYAPSNRPTANRLYMLSFVTNCMEVLRGCKMLTRYNVGNITTASDRVSHYTGGESWNFYRDDSESTNTESVAVAANAWYLAASIYTSAHRDDIRGAGSRTRYGPTSAMEFYVNPRITHTLLTTGGVMRVESIDVYLGTSVGHTRAWYDYTAGTYGSESHTVRAVFFAGTATDKAKDDEGNSVFSFSVQPLNVVDQAIAASGIAFPSGKWYPMLQDEYTTESYSASLEGPAMLVVHVKPWTRLQGW